MNSRIYKIFYLVLFTCNLQAQELLPFVENYSKYNFNGDNQIWNVAQGTDNAIYFANNHYFLRFDGVRWEKYMLPNKTIIRSVFVVGDRIYSGSYKEFGYWFRKDGKMKYVSLSSSQKLFSDDGNEEIWKIFTFSGRIYFQSFNEIYSYEKGVISVTKLPFQISYAFPVDGELLLTSVKNGVFRMNGQSFTKLTNWTILNDNVVHSIEKYKGHFYVFTQKNGVFIGDKTELHPWNNSLNSILKSSIINVAKFVGRDKLVIGTASKGIYIINMNDGSYSTINRENVLINSSVLSIGFDKENDLWLGLDNGIAHVEINSPIAIFSDNSGQLGSVYSVAAQGSGYLLASNHGVFSYSNKKMMMVPNSQGQAWDIKKVGNQFIIGHNEGTFSYQDGNFSKLNSINGGWNLSKSTLGNNYLQAAYSGIIVYNNDFSKSIQIRDFYKPIRYVAQNKQNELWAADNYRGLYRVNYDANFKAIKSENITQRNTIKSDFGVRIFEFRGEMLFLINNLWYTYNSISGQLDKNDLFNRNFPAVSDISAIDDDNFMIMQSGVLYLIRAEGSKFIWNFIQEKYYRNKIINDNLKIFKDGKNYLLNLDDGFISIQSQNFKSVKPLLKFEAYSNDKLITEGEKIDYSTELVINVISGKYGSAKPNLFYKNDGNKALKPLRDGRLLLNNLGSGNHRLIIYTNDGSGLVTVATYNFSVALPWYFSLWMILLYLAAILTSSFLYYRWNKIRYQQKLLVAQEELRHQKKIIEIELKAENEIKIQEYEKHILELEVQAKSSEVAGKSLSIAKQSEMIDSIRNILESEHDLVKIKNEIRKTIKINSANRHEWESFESNITQIHNSFILALSARYPSLTAKDIKLSIYLKMNLSSKEIAPLLNISFRGVELHRYRLRKKLGIPTDASLYKFMISI